VELVIRLLAGGFAEKSRVMRVRFTDEVRQLLLQYRFPGNIRMLKNVVEQISVLSTGDRVIDAATLKQYLPQESNLPALLPSSAAEKDAISERDLLYKVLFDMKRDMVDLKKLVLDIYNNQGKGGQLVKDHP